MIRTNLARAAMHALAKRVQHDRIVIREGSRSHDFGRADGAFNIEFVVHDPSAYEMAIRAGSVGLGGSYAAGAWDTNDLTGSLRVLLRAARPALDVQDAFVQRKRSLTARARSNERPSRNRDVANIRAHYDISNAFFSLMLDSTMAYSCGIFDTPTTTLEQASVAKFRRVCEMLSIASSDHIVEIGTGWGGFAVYAAQHYGCRVTTTTISEEQFDFASKRVAEAGLTDRVTVLREHYRDLAGTFDALVSIEMIEAVPWWELDDFFAAINALLKPGARALVQGISMNDASYERSKRHDDFIKHFIFPGSNLPSMAAMQRSARRSQLVLRELFDIGEHYPTTLRAWDANLDEQADQVAVVAPHLDNDHFRRLWKFYLAYCEAAFLERHITVAQTVWSNDGQGKVQQ